LAVRLSLILPRGNVLLTSSLGGLSYLSDLYGLACDNVENYEVSQQIDNTLLIDTGMETNKVL
jgi:hypothetical protein